MDTQYTHAHAVCGRFFGIDATGLLRELEHAELDQGQVAQTEEMGLWDFGFDWVGGPNALCGND
jgi:hypothetical protein